MTGMDGINSLQKMLGALQVNDSASVNGAQTASKAGNTATSVRQSASMDQANFSAAGMASQVTDTSDVRLTKVAELRQAIASGSYNVPASAVADKMVESMMG